METLQAKPAYHHPIPWQVVTALPLIGCNVLSLALQTSALLILCTSPPRPELDPWLTVVLLHLIVAAVAAVANAVAGVCIAARQDWARTTAIALCVLQCFYYVPIAVGFGLFPLATGSDFTGAVVFPVSGALAFCLALLYLLHNEEAAAYTYKGGGGHPPEA